MPRKLKSPEAIAHAAEYQRAKFSTLGTTVPRSTADDFRRWCAENGTTVHAEIKRMIEEKIKKAED